MEFSTVLIWLLIIGVAVLLIRYKLKSDEKEKALEEEATKKYIEEFQKAGERFERSGVPSIDSDVSLKKAETLHVKLGSINWMEYRKVRTGRVSGHGVTGRIKIAKGVYYRYGTGQMKAESMDQLTQIDSGDLYVTNKGFFFRGHLGNKTLPFDKILQPTPLPKGLKMEKDTGKDVYIVFDFTQYPDKAAAIVLLWDKQRNS